MNRVWGNTFVLATVPVEELRAALALGEQVRYRQPPCPRCGGEVRWNDKNRWRWGGCYPPPAELPACLAQ